MAEEKVEQGQKKGSAVKLIIIGVVAILLLGGGAVAFFMLKKKAPEQLAATPAAVAVNAPAVTVPLKSFIVNLMDPRGIGKRYLKMTMELEILGEQNKALLEKNEYRIRDTVLMLLSSLSSAEVGSMEGKINLKRSIVKRINEVLGAPVVKKVYFIEFVVQ